MSITVKLNILGEPMGKQRPKATSINGYVRTLLMELLTQMIVKSLAY